MVLLRAQLFTAYEYEEDMYLSLDGSATLYVNSSIPALVALRGVDLDTGLTARVDVDAVRSLYSSPDTHVTRVTMSRRSGRQFVHVRISVDDVNRLGEAAPLAWSSYRFAPDGERFRFEQRVGAAVGRQVADSGWSGSETVAFRLHLPSRITFHNAGPDNLHRGNILVWEQPLRDRLRGKPLIIEAQMESQSILYRTLWLFGLTALAVVAMFAVIIWRLTRKRTKQV